MKTSIARPMCTTLFAAVAGFAASHDASAAVASRLFYQNGGNACTGALPTFEGALRKRPKAIANEGSNIAFVTCSVAGDDYNTAKPSTVFIGFSNPTGASQSVTCTLVDGNAAYPTTTTYPKTMQVPAGATNFQDQWIPTAPATEFGTPTLGVSCALPPGIALNFFGYGIAQDIGT